MKVIKMLRSEKLLPEDLSTIDWSKFNCKAILDEVTENLKIVCEIQSDHPNTAALKERDPPKQIEEEKGGRQEWDNMIGI